MAHWSQDLYLEAWLFAATAHGAQKVPGSDRPYITHVGCVAMEVMSAIARSGDAVARPDLAVRCALLHDVMEDAGVTHLELIERFGVEVADGVRSLSKDERIPSKTERMRDSLERIRQQPVEVWMVKLADRITNLQPPPPFWSPERINAYCDEASLILERLRGANAVLEARLEEKITAYAAELRVVLARS